MVVVMWWSTLSKTRVHTTNQSKQVLHHLYEFCLEVTTHLHACTQAFLKLSLTQKAAVGCTQSWYSPEGAPRVEVRQQHLHLPGPLPEDGHRQKGVDEVLRVVEEVRKGVPLDHLFFSKHNERWI